MKSYYAVKFNPNDIDILLEIEINEEETKYLKLARGILRITSYRYSRPRRIHYKKCFMILWGNNPEILKLSISPCLTKSGKIMSQKSSTKAFFEMVESAKNKNFKFNSK